jgi:saxitoxin biosynthesis operon SxtJ-like protein
MVNEDKKQDAVEMGSERSFALVFAGFFSLVGCWPLIHGNALRPWALAVAAVFLLLGLLRPTMLRPLNIVWFKLSLLLAKIMTPVVMGLLYVTTIIPIGVVLRMRGKDLLALALQSDRNTYWIIRKPPGPNAGSMKRQF